VIDVYKKSKKTCGIEGDTIEKVESDPGLSPFLGNSEVGRWIDMHRLSFRMLHDFLLNMDSDFGGHLVGSRSDGYSSALPSE
jgi:hypothetical protein